jgi:hypothetical protein
MTRYDLFADRSNKAPDALIKYSDKPQHGPVRAHELKPLKIPFRPMR